MRRICCIFLLSFTLASFALSANDFMVTAESVALKETTTSGAATTSDALKKLLDKKIELESVLAHEKNRVLDEEKAYNELKKDIGAVEEKMKERNQILEKIHPTISSEVFLSAPEDIDALIQKKEILEKEILALLVSLSPRIDGGPFYPDMPIEEVERQFAAVRKVANNSLHAYELIMKKAQKERDDFIVLKKQDLSQLLLEIERTQYVKKNQISSAIKKILLYISIFLGIIIIQYISGRILARFQEDFSRSHKEAMWFVHRWSFRAIFLIAFLVLFSSEFSAFLPFIAIMATAIGFALRDVVYSFIGWFMIGASDGYEEGDIIQIEDLQGKVFHITPLLTTLEEHGIQGVTGKMVSFPNKVIFDKTVKNFSRAHGFTFISLDFILTHTSDIDRAREILMGIIGQQDLTLYYNSRNVLNKLRYTYGYSDSDLHPRIDVIVDTSGIILRAKVFVHVEDIINMRSKISEEFCKNIQREKNVMLQKG